MSNSQSTSSSGFSLPFLIILEYCEKFSDLIDQIVTDRNHIIYIFIVIISEMSFNRLDNTCDFFRFFDCYFFRMNIELPIDVFVRERGVYRAAEYKAAVLLHIVVGLLLAVGLDAELSVEHKPRRNVVEFLFISPIISGFLMLRRRP